MKDLVSERKYIVPPVKSAKFTRKVTSGFLMLTRHGGILLLVLGLYVNALAESIYTNDQIADAIYFAEGGAHTSHPYGILAHYKHTTPRQACLNTIAHAKRDWNGNGDFICFLASRYCPVGAANDPTGLNKNWIKNVKHFLSRR